MTNAQHKIVAEADRRHWKRERRLLTGRAFAASTKTAHQYSSRWFTGAVGWSQSRGLLCPENDFCRSDLVIVLRGLTHRLALILPPSATRPIRWKEKLR